MTKQLATTITPEEIQRRNRYWFEHWYDFRTEVVIHTPVERSGYVGGSYGHLFGAVPVPYHTSTSERGLFWITPEGFATVATATYTYSWDLHWTQVVVYPNGVEIREPNSPVITISGPVGPPIVGAMAAFGLAINL